MLVRPWLIPVSHVCPNCGWCPSCGRAEHHVPRYPAYPIYTHSPSYGLRDRVANANNAVIRLSGATR